MKNLIFATTAACSLLFVTTAFGGQADNHASTWHGHGSGHQANNNPGDTAGDRHNFGDATAGNSGKNPPAETRSGKKN